MQLVVSIVRHSVFNKKSSSEYKAISSMLRVQTQVGFAVMSLLYKGILSVAEFSLTIA